MRRMDARRKKAKALRFRFSQSLANLRQRFSQAMVRSTIQRRGSTVKLLDHRVEQQTQGIDKNMPFFAFDFLACIIAIGIDASAAFFRALHALAINDGSGRTRFAVIAFAARNIERMMHTIQRAVETA
jgi:hypothetical protein